MTATGDWIIQSPVCISVISLQRTSLKELYYTGTFDVEK
jgi:hypothetical protein